MRGPTPRRNIQAGITLVEMLVVLSIIAVAAGLVMLRFPGQRGTDVAGEAAALALLLDAASTQALATGRPRVLVWQADRYALMQWLPGSGWQTQDGTSRNLSADAALSRSDGGTAALVIGSDALTPPARFAIGSGQAAWLVAFDGIGATALPGAAP